MASPRRSRPSASARPGSRGRVLALCASAVLATMASVLAGGVASAAPAPGAGSPNPASDGHAYRHGAVPLRGSRPPGAARFGGSTVNDLAYRGGIGGVGVMTGPPKIYLIFYGSQWGAQTLDSLGYYEYSGDPQGMAPDIEAFFAGLGSNNDLWSGVMTQYCQGVSIGATVCGTTGHVGYPAGSLGSLGGVWEDTATPSPSQATANQLAQEAVRAAGAFGNTTSASNRDAEYFILSPTGTYPDGFNTPSGGFCAWHDYTADSTMDGGGAVNSPYGALAFANMPYVTDMGYQCGAGFVNFPGTLDGVTIVGGHEYAETLTDQFPAGGWVDSSGAENGDKCAWISSGQGAATNLSLSTGTFAVQSTWANDFNGGSGGCETSHPIVTNSATNTVTVTNPGNQTSTAGTAISPLQITATDSASGQTLTYGATGLPAGLSIGSSTGTITGTPTTAVTNASVTVTATDSTGAKGSTTFSWTVNPAPANTVTVTNPGNQTSATGTAIAPLQISASDSASGQTLTYGATGLPAGLSIGSSSGTITGTPTQAVLNASVTVTATDTTGAKGSTTFSWTVNSPGGNTVTVTNPGNQTSTAGTAISPLQMSASDSQLNQTLSYSATGLPTGLSISSSGRISGTPSAAGTFSPTVTATDSTGAKGSTSFTWTVNAAANVVTVTNPGNQTTRVNTSVSLQIHASDSASGQTLTYSANILPNGLSINPSTGLISGTVRTVGSTTVTVTVMDSTGASKSVTFTWMVKRH